MSTGVEQLTGAGRALRRDAAENRRRVLDAAEQVFAVQGLEASVEEIAQVAGVGMGTLYRRFPTKEALISELVRELLERVLMLAHEALPTPGGAGLEQFLIASAAAQVQRRGCLTRLWNDAETVALKQQCRAVIATLLADAQANGRIRDDADAGDIDLAFWSVRGVIEASRGRGEAAWRRHLAIVIAGLRPDAGSLDAPALTPQELADLRNPLPADSSHH